MAAHTRRKPAKLKKLSQPSKFGSVKATRSDSKQAKVIELLRRSKGARIEELVEATGWQPHSVRGLLSGKIKKMSGVKLTAEKPTDGTRRYYLKTA